MFKPFGFLGLIACALTLSAAAFAQSNSAASVGAPSRELVLSAAQQAALGIQTTRVSAAKAQAVLASAQVSARPGADVTVSAPYAGQLARLNVGIGDRVNVGAGLADFTSAQLGEARRQWDEARLQWQTAQAALKRDQSMLEEGIIPAVRLQLTQSRYDAAQAALQARAAELQSTRLRFESNASAAGYATGVLLAPIAGWVAETNSAVGQRVEAGTVLFRIIDDKDLQLEFQLAPDKAARVRVGDTVDIAQRNARARIIGISPYVQAGQMAKGRASVTQRGQLRLGDTLSISIQASGSATESVDAWQLPARALSSAQGQSMVFVRTDKGFVAQAVKVMASNDDISIVQGAGLNAQSSVASAGVAALRGLLLKDE